MEVLFDQAHIMDLLYEVCDPEIPVLSIIDLGIIRDVNVEGEKIEVVITPTYSGCPAMNMIEVNIKALLQEKGYKQVFVKTILSPAWTTDWLTESGRQKLFEYGIAPPVGKSQDKTDLFPEDKIVACPQCKSENTKMTSQFGSTACKSMYKCLDCLEPFDYFKCH